MARKPREKREPDEALTKLPRLAYTVKEAAHMLGASEGSVRQWIYEGKLRAISKGKGHDRQHYSIPMKSIQDLLDSAGSAPE